MVQSDSLPADQGRGKRVSFDHWWLGPSATIRAVCCRARTQPIVVTLNVAETLEDLDLHPGLLTVAEAMNVREELHQDDDPESFAVDDEMAAIEAR